MAVGTGVRVRIRTADDVVVVTACTAGRGNRSRMVIGIVTFKAAGYITRAAAHAVVSVNTTVGHCLRIAAAGSVANRTAYQGVIVKALVGMAVVTGIIMDNNDHLVVVIRRSMTACTGCAVRGGYHLHAAD